MAAKVMCLRYNGEVEETALSVDEAGNLMGQFDNIAGENHLTGRLHLFINHTFSCYEDCSVYPCLGPLCPN